MNGYLIKVLVLLKDSLSEDEIEAENLSFLESIENQPLVSNYRQFYREFKKLFEKVVDYDLILHLVPASEQEHSMERLKNTTFIAVFLYDEGAKKFSLEKGNKESFSYFG
ncbi:TPA: hypothetical protein DEP21_00270 [Patescibacteria group bacterium]|nr:hypothetical protein [Candidatus Gracilibacteria bacterium]